MQSKINKAYTMYNKALPYWRGLNMEVEQALILNNQAFTEGLMGKFGDARRHVQDALSLRTRLGSGPQIVLSETTWAEIETYAGYFREAFGHADRALKLAFRLDFLRGEGLARLALAAIYRYQAEPENITDRPIRAILEDAMENAGKALEIFKSPEEDAEFHVRALYEMGVIYRQMYPPCRQIEAGGPSVS